MIVYQNVLVIVPARSGSKSIVNKNLQLVGEHSLVRRACLAGLSLHNSTVLLTTDSNKIADEVRDLGVTVFFRSPHLGSDSATTEEVVLEVVQTLRPSQISTIVLIQPTSPFIHKDDLSLGLEAYYANPSSTIFSAKKHLCFSWTVEDTKWTPVRHSSLSRAPRQSLPFLVAENGAFWIFDKELFLKNPSRYCGHPIPVITSEASNYEIDVIEDLLLARDVAPRIDKTLVHLNGI